MRRTPSLQDYVLKMKQMIFALLALMTHFVTLTGKIQKTKTLRLVSFYVAFMMSHRRGYQLLV